jgi:hypothetical protein
MLHKRILSLLQNLPLFLYDLSEIQKSCESLQVFVWICWCFYSICNINKGSQVHCRLNKCSCSSLRCCQIVCHHISLLNKKKLQIVVNGVQKNQNKGYQQNQSTKNYYVFRSFPSRDRWLKVLHTSPCTICLVCSCACTWNLRGHLKLWMALSLISRKFLAFTVNHKFLRIWISF